MVLSKKILIFFVKIKKIVVKTKESVNNYWICSDKNGPKTDTGQGKLIGLFKPRANAGAKG